MTLKNTKNSAVISIKNNQSAEGMNECVELMSEGRFYKSGDKFYIFYTEEDTQQGTDTTVMITVEEKKVVMSRKGESAYRMIYEKGSPESVVYHTPYGDMTMQLSTEEIENNLTEAGGALRICYKLIINGDEINNDLTIKVKSEKE